MLEEAKERGKVAKMRRQEEEEEEEEAIIRGTVKCQDCGNQAKKGCVYMRCRTCCNNKGFDCQTHVKSTWVPVYRRRLREHQDHHYIHPHNFQPDIPKRPKHLPSSAGLDQQLKFPAAMSSVATFRCVRVQSMDDSVDEYAYQTSVNIGGHVFSGLLYDQGPRRFDDAGGDSSATAPHVQYHSNLINAAAAATQSLNGASMAAPPLPATAAPESLLPPPYPFSYTFMPGMPNFFHPRS